jgi:ubiquinone/menaquinone biosynthesis C-methylase UbiE
MHRRGRKFDPERMAYLESEERRALLDPPRLLQHFEIQRGWIVADVGCGPGFFTFPLAGIVGSEGRVYGVDEAPQMIVRLKERIESLHARNVLAVLSTEDSIPLPDGIADFALLSMVLHELDGLSTLMETRRILKASGKLGVVDWKKKTELIGPPRRHRLGEDEAAAMLRSVGFDPGPPLDIAPSHYGFNARRI